MSGFASLRVKHTVIIHTYIAHGSGWWCCCLCGVDGYGDFRPVWVFFLVDELHA